MPPRNLPFNPTAALATTRIYPDGDYELVIGEPKVFYRKSNEGQPNEKEVYGILYPLTIAEGEYRGERYTHNLWLHSENAAGMVKQFLLVGTGFELTAEAEEQYNAAHEHDAPEDWDVDYDAKTCGPAWHALKGHRVIFTFGVKPNEQTGAAQQSIKKMRPLA